MPEANGHIDIKLETYYQNSSTVGYTCEKCDTIYFNRKFHSGYDAFDGCGNLFHEWLHKLGFAHAKKWSYSRDFSVPYAVGDIVESLAKEIKLGKTLTPLSGVAVVIEPEPIPEVKPELKTYCTRSWKTLWLVKNCWKE
jgi:hypothetical protein